MDTWRKNSVIKTKWKCCDCGAIHDEWDDARECCPTPVREVFPCPVCNAAHYDEADALDCCGFAPDEAPPPTAEELENAGQLRMEGF